LLLLILFNLKKLVALVDNDKNISKINGLRRQPSCQPSVNQASTKGGLEGYFSA
jgi:hypothetical protein